MEALGELRESPESGKGRHDEVLRREEPDRVFALLLLLLFVMPSQGAKPRITAKNRSCPTNFTSSQDSAHHNHPSVNPHQSNSKKSERKYN